MEDSIVSETTDEYDFIKVCEEDGDSSMELPTEENGTVLLSTVQGQFPNAVGLRYKSTSGGWRGVRIVDGVLKSPQGGWSDTHFFATLKNSGSRSKSDGDDDGGKYENKGEDLLEDVTDGLKVVKVTEHIDIEREVEGLSCCLENITDHMRTFSSSMRKLYSDEAVEADSQIANDFRKIRNDTRNDALVFKQNVLPMTTEAVRLMDEFVNYYLELDFDTWKENLSSITDEACANEMCCRALIMVYKDIMRSLKEREDEATVKVKEMTTLEAKYEKESEELKMDAGIKRKLAIGLAFIPVLGSFIAAPLLGLAARQGFAKALEKKGEAETCHTLKDVFDAFLVSALHDFTEGLGIIAGFFKAVENELITLREKAEKGRDDPKHLHYIMMRRYANKISAECKGFFRILPSVHTDFDVIPLKDTDQNYIDKWLQRQQRQIEKEFSKPIAVRVLKTIRKISLEE